MSRRNRRGVGGGALPSTVEDDLLDAGGAVKEADRVRVVERVDGEVRRRESPRRQQGAEDEDRLIAALPRLGTTSSAG